MLLFSCRLALRTMHRDLLEFAVCLHYCENCKTNIHVMGECCDLVAFAAASEQGRYFDACCHAVCVSAALRIACSGDATLLKI